MTDARAQNRFRRVGTAWLASLLLATLVAAGAPSFASGTDAIERLASTSARELSR